MVLPFPHEVVVCHNLKTESIPVPATSMLSVCLDPWQHDQRVFCMAAQGFRLHERISAHLAIVSMQLDVLRDPLDGSAAGYVRADGLYLRFPDVRQLRNTNTRRNIAYDARYAGCAFILSGCSTHYCACLCGDYERLIGLIQMPYVVEGEYPVPHFPGFRIKSFTGVWLGASAAPPIPRVWNTHAVALQMLIKHYTGGLAGI